MKKKIIFVTTALWIGGIETALVNLLRQMDYLVYDVTLLVLRAELDMLDQIPEECRVIIIDRDKTVTFKESYRFSRLYHLTEKSDHPSLLHRMMMWSVPIIRWFENTRYIQYVQNLMKDEHYDTAIIYSDVVGEITVKAIQADRYLMYYHHGAMRHVYHDQLPWEKCEKIIAVSDNQCGLLKDYFSKYRDKITVIHNLTEIKKIKNKAACVIEEVFDNEQFNIVSVGRVSHEKGMDLAVRTCAKLVADGFNYVHWWIVGGGPAMQEVYDTIHETHMEAYITTVGMKANPYPYIRLADLYVQPSRFEGYPMTILEACILGKAIISTNNNGAREILEEKNLGVLTSMDPEQIAIEIETLLKQQEKLRIMRCKVEAVDFHRMNQECIHQLEAIL